MSIFFLFLFSLIINMEFCWDYTSQIGNANLCVMYTVSTLNIYILPEQKIYVFGHTWFHVTHYELSKYLGQVMLHVRVWDYIPQWECKPCVIMFSICSSFSNWFWAECSNFYNFCWKCSTILLKIPLWKSASFTHMLRPEIPGISNDAML